LNKKSNKRDWRRLFMIMKEMKIPARTTVSAHRFNIAISGLAIRLLIAFIVSWLIVLAFFVSGAVSR